MSDQNQTGENQKFLSTPPATATTQAPAAPAVTTPVTDAATPPVVPTPLPQADAVTKPEVSDQEEEQATAPDEKKMLMSRAKLMGITFSNNITVEALREKINVKLAEGSQGSEDDEDEDEEFDEEEEELPVLEPQPGAVPLAPTQDPATYRPQLDHDHDGKNGGSLSEVERKELEELRALVAENNRNAALELESQALNPLEDDTVDKKAAARMSKRARIRRESLALIRIRITNLDPKKKDLPGEILTIANKYVGTIRKFVPYGEVTDNGYHVEKIIYDELEGRRFVHIRTFKDRRTGQQRVETSNAKEFAIEVLPPLTQEELQKLAAEQAARGSIGATDS